MTSNKRTVEELLKENELLKKTIEVQRNTINNLLNKYVLNKKTQNVK